MKPPEPTLLFVYGSLRRDAAGKPHPLLGPDAVWQGPAHCRGRLYRVASYPGAVLDDGCADLVHGELYALPRPEAIWPVLDAWEDCAPHAADPEYQRLQITVTRPDGSRCTAWIYRYLRDVDESTRIASGRHAP